MGDNSIHIAENSKWIVEIGSEESTVRALLRGIAAIKGVAETDLDPLFESIETDALDDLVQHADDHDQSASVEFTYEGFTILVGPNDEIRVANYTLDEVVTGPN